MAVTGDWVVVALHGKVDVQRQTLALVEQVGIQRLSLALVEQPHQLGSLGCRDEHWRLEKYMYVYQKINLMK